MASTEKKPSGQEGADDEQEDTPTIKELKAIDEKYCEIEKEFQRVADALRTSYEHEKLNPLLEERAKVLADLTLPGAEAEKEYGTPACVSFWLEAFQNAVIGQYIEEHDAPVLTYLRDVKVSCLDDNDRQKGFKLEFLFVENPFFFNSSLWVEFHMDYDPETNQPWKEQDCRETRSCDIGWKPGKDVTVELVENKVQKKGKAGRGKQAQQKAKATVEPRDSIFRILFRNLKLGDKLPEDIVHSIKSANGEIPDSLDADQVVKRILGSSMEVGSSLADEIVPYAVRFFTGEVGGDDDDDDEDDDDEEDDDDDDEEDSDEEPATKSKKKVAQKKGAAAFAPEARTGEKQEECKQQ